MFIGSGRLLVACAEAWLESGQGIQGIVSDCPEVSAWSNAKGITRIPTSEDQAAWLSREPFDYLFSVVNHAITSPDILALPRRRAINYHDSPLPRYAGFNATAWAIIDGQTQHAVTWHEMSADVDSGAILLQLPIEISEDDTSFSLGAKCVEIGLDGFRQLIGLLTEEVSTGRSMLTSNQGSRQNFHLRSERPDLGLIDFQQRTAAIHSFVRGLDLGSDDNWMCRPKLHLPSGMFVVGDAAYARHDGAPSGSVVAIDKVGLTIAATDGALRFSSLSTLEGLPVDPTTLGLRVGQVIAPVSPEFREAARAFDAVLTKSERFWVERLSSLREPVIADLRPHTGPVETALEVRAMTSALASVATDPRSAVIAALVAYIARVGEGGEIDIALHKAVPSQIACAYAPSTPLRINVDLSADFAALCALVENELQSQDRRATYARDVVTRYNVLRNGAPRAALSIGVRLQPLEGLPPSDALVPGTHLTLVIADSAGAIGLAYDRKALSDTAARALVDRVDVLLAAGLQQPSRPVGQLDILPNIEREHLLADWQDTAKPYASDRCVHELFEAQVALTPDAVAITFKGESLTYRELDQRANGMAEMLRARGVGPEVLVAVCIERSLDLMVGLMGVLKAGGAYVPLDPVYPRGRLSMMLEDSSAKVLLTQRRLVGRVPAPEADIVCVEDLAGRVSAQSPRSGATPDNLAYVIFTSGSTGRPKGVMVRHGNVSNFFTGMDAAIGAEPGVWLAVTSISFDISVLELFWTLTRGFEVVIQSESDRASQSQSREVPIKVSKAPMAFGLFYFAADQGGSAPGGAYRLLLEGAKFADKHDFSAVWTPERHFHAFGGLYPNPAVTTAALATITSRVALRAGSIVLPLHNPLRVAEDWSVIDQLSGGRVGLSFASGWHVNDFAFMPQAYERRREIMLESIETVMKLWRGERVEVENGQGKSISVSVLPRPIQAAPPMWLASAGSVDTFKLAGRLGANVLTNMLGQDIEDLRNKFAAYRAARQEAGFEGPGNISVMLHTFVCEDTERARELARKPFGDYLRSSFDLVKIAPTMFPAFRQPSLEVGREAVSFDATRFTEEDMAALMDHAFDRYFETAGLFGSPEKALGMIENLKSIGATEVACLIDFGVDPEIVLESLPHLDRLRRLANSQTQEIEDVTSVSIADQIRDRGVTHLQCTPSMARMLTGDAEGLASLSGLKRLMLGGEALPTDLVEILAPVVRGEIHNMYGPTETTIWSTTALVRAGQAITIGRPIANTVIRILDARGQITPVGVAGELCIGGAGVVRGYLGRPDLTAERFVADPYDPNGRLYRTGDLARFSENGEIEFLGRLDLQVKVNGYRIELGEIETVIGRHPAVRQNVVMARSDGGLAQLVAYVIPHGGDNAKSDTDRVAQWEGLWDEAYKEAGEVPDPRFNIAGWKDSYTGTSIPIAEMREWLDHTGRNILALKPKRVLEIGCGTGMVLYRVAPHVEHYTGVDLSPYALETISKELTADERTRVTLLQQPAHALKGVAEQSCDTVVINSVSQYFPDSKYLAQVLKRASELVIDGGRIFVGDVRSYDHLEAFQTLVALHQSPGHLDVAELSRRIDKRVLQEGELVVSEAFFHALKRDLPRLSAVDVRLKRGQANNEMSVFRFDVVLHVGPQASGAEFVKLPTASNLQSLEEIKRALVAAPPIVVVENLKNARLSRVYAVRGAIVSSSAANADALRQVLDNATDLGVNPEDLFHLSADYDVDVVWARSGDPTRFDAVLRHKVTGPKGRLDLRVPSHDQPALRYANQPAKAGSDQGALFEELRAHLREFLPEYMIPAAFVIVDAFPLTANGKIDRKALPAPTREAAQSAVEYVPPSNDLEKIIADVWKQLLNIERVGLRDNIFDIGANSLLTAQANQRLSILLDRKVSLVSMFRFPTVESLAAHIDPGRAAPEQDAKRTQERADRKKDAAERRRELRGASNSR
ncbi:MAG: LLM class flavin-dependent oxidoreductase [Hyphomonadaceae bacterium]|nr:LLM class flavin-dependent oxidoreductase [Hyphomonadaceae bacterium]